MSLTKKLGGSLVQLLGMNFGRKTVGADLGRWSYSVLRDVRGE